MIREFSDPDLHDVTILSLELKDDSTLEIRCRGDAAKPLILTVSGLVDLRADAFSTQNVISSVVLYSESDCPETLLRSLAWDLPVRVRTLGEALRNGKGAVVHISSAVGCQLVAYFVGEIRAD